MSRHLKAWDATGERIKIGVGVILYGSEKGCLEMGMAVRKIGEDNDTIGGS